MKNNRKGFTIVELVIVIAVIAILAGVLIPTFAGVTSKAKDSKALQEAKNAYTADLAILNGQVTADQAKDTEINGEKLAGTFDLADDKKSYTYSFTNGDSITYTYSSATGTWTKG